MMFYNTDWSWFTHVLDVLVENFFDIFLRNEFYCKWEVLPVDVSLASDREFLYGEEPGDYLS